MREVAVSEPSHLLLVRESYEGIDETTLVVPDLPLANLAYARFLVDGDKGFEEHAVGAVSRGLTTDQHTVVTTALSVARPTAVTLVRENADGVWIEGVVPRRGLEAAAVFIASRSDDSSRSARLSVNLTCEGRALRFLVRREGRFFLVWRED